MWYSIHSLLIVMSPSKNLKRELGSSGSTRSEPMSMPNTLQSVSLRMRAERWWPMKPLTPRIRTLVAMLVVRRLLLIPLPVGKRQFLIAEARTERHRVAHPAVELKLEQPQCPVRTHGPHLALHPAQPRLRRPRRVGRQGPQDPQWQTRRQREGTGVRRRHRPHQIVHGRDPQLPVYRAIGSGTAAKVAAA